MEDLIGKTIDRYKIVSELGRGGMAVVYRAMDTLLDRSVAIKLILPENEDNSHLLRRFNREAKILAKLSHVNIVKVMDFGEYEGCPYLVMEYIPGGTLKAKIGERWNYVDAAAMLAPIARALGYAHSQKVVHRDIKPANVLLNETGQPLISDFGILKLVDAEESQGLTGTGKVVGTPSYMSPEQIRGQEVDGRADLYSLGVVLYEMITGQKPYTANTPIEVSLKHLNESTPKARQIVRDLPPEVEQFLLKAMSKKAEDRFQTGVAMADALDKLSRKQSAVAKPATTITNEFKKPVEKEKKGLPAYTIAVIAVLVTLVAFFGVWLGMGHSSSSSLAGAAGLQPGKSPVASATSTLVPPSATPTLHMVPPSPTPTSVASLIRTDTASRIIEVNRLEGISVIKLDWMENGQYIILAGSSGISFINPQTLTVSHKVSVSNDLPISMAVSPLNDKVFALLSTKVVTIDIATAKVTRQFSITESAYSIAVSSDGRLIALGIMDNKVQLLNASDGSVVQNLGSNYGGWSIAFSPDASRVAEGNSQGILMWETNTGTWVPLANNPKTIIKCIAFSDDGALVAGGSKGEIYVWEVASGKRITRITGDIGTISSLDFSPNGTILISGSDDSYVRLWSPTSGTALFVLKGHTSPVYSAVFSPDGDFIVSGAQEGTIRMWSIP